MQVLVQVVRSWAASDEHIHVQKVTGHGCSSRSWFTRSSVAGTAAFRLGRSGMPFRSALLVREPRESPWRASDEITSPMLLCSRSARCLAAARTSSSMASVILMASTRRRMRCRASYVTHHPAGGDPGTQRNHRGRRVRGAALARAQWPLRSRGHSRARCARAAGSAFQQGTVAPRVCRGGAAPLRCCPTDRRGVATFGEAMDFTPPSDLHCS